MKLLLIILLVVFAVCDQVEGQTSTVVSGQMVETIVCIRHGKIPRDQLRQLICRGLNRALALLGVKVLSRNFVKRLTKIPVFHCLEARLIG